MEEGLWQVAGFLAALAFVLLNVALAWVIAYWTILHKLPLLRKILHSLFDWEMKDVPSQKKGSPRGAIASVSAAPRDRPSEGVPRPHAD
jgi:hypothetical protein